MHAGSMACFLRAHEYISGFKPVPAALVVGNHDLEGDDFETDEENLAAWRQVCGALRKIHAHASVWCSRHVDIRCSVHMLEKRHMV